MDARCALLLIVLLQTCTLKYTACSDRECTSGKHMVLPEDGSILIESPKFQGRKTYPPNSFCSWTVTTSSDTKKVIKAQFEMLSIWPTYGCAFDEIVLFDGNSTSSEVLAKYCTVGIPSEPQITSDSALHIIFHSSDITQLRFEGFALRLIAVNAPTPCDDQVEITCHNRLCVNKKLVCDHKDDCGDGTDEETCGYVPRHRKLACGRTPIPPSLGNGDRIVGGQPAVKGSWPWQGSLRRRGKPPSYHLCGAVILNDMWLLTAAHCFRNMRNVSLWSVHIGKFYIEKDEEAEQTRYIREIIIHPNYRGFSLNPDEINRKENDIALLRVNAPIFMKNDTQPICLPPWRMKIPGGTKCHVTGWGSTLGTGNPDILKQAEVPIVSNEVCSRMYENRIQITSGMLCAGFENGGHDSCKGDSGGPLVVARGDRWYLVGLVATGGNCAAAMQPGIYTRVSHFKWWISKTIFRVSGQPY